jgi:hypothetical protein
MFPKQKKVKYKITGKKMKAKKLKMIRDNFQRKKYKFKGW